MKGIQKRLYSALPRVVAPPSTTTTPSRVRSNSASSPRTFHTNPSALPLSFFDSPPPPPSSRPGNPHVISTNRIPVEPKGTGEAHQQSSHSHTHGQAPPYSLAVTSPQISHNSPNPQNQNQYSTFFPYSHFSSLPLHADPAASTPAQLNSTPSPSKRPRLRYQLDVGGYGIPKRCRSATTRHTLRSFNTTAAADHDSCLSVQVGEDAYFVRDNAMGVADGVGGWARARGADVPPLTNPNAPSPSALFARRLMHFCSAEMEATESLPDSVSPHTGFRSHHPVPHRPASPIVNAWPWSTPIIPNNLFGPIVPDPFEEPEFEYELDHDIEQDPMEELAEGLDVLMILEKAYERTLKAHVVPPTTPPPVDKSRIAEPPENPVPLMAGSSTALLAILDEVPNLSVCSNLPSDHDSQKPTFTLNTDTDTNNTTNTTPDGGATAYHPVLKIAHVGDCMAMLVRDDEIAWRSEEMWWGFNTPVQLGPLSPITPQTLTRSQPKSPDLPSTTANAPLDVDRDQAQTFTIPVRANDILILASDGLSDNLWDEDVLDEVRRFTSGWLQTSSASELGADTLHRRTLPGMLSEALCSRARRVSERRASASTPRSTPTPTAGVEDEVPFARRAREQGRSFRGGKNDDISVIVAVISPRPRPKFMNESSVPHSFDTTSAT